MNITLTPEELADHNRNVDLFYRQAMNKYVDRLFNFVSADTMRGFNKEKGEALEQYKKDITAPPKIINI